MINYDYKDIVKEIINANQIIWEHKDKSVPYEYQEQEQLKNALKVASFYDNNQNHFSKDQKRGIEPLVRGFVDYCFRGNTAVTKN